MKAPSLLAILLAFHSIRLFALDAIVEDDFQKPLNEKIWVVPIKQCPLADGGRLVWKLEGGDSSRDLTLAIRLRDPLDKLNFVRTPLKISLSNIAFSDTATQEGCIFMLLLSSNQTAEQLADAYFKLRIDGTGKIVLATPGALPGGEKGERTLLQTQAALPIQSLQLELDPHLIRLTVQDSSGSCTLEGDWKKFLDQNAWQNAAPFLIMKAIRKTNVEGAPEISMGKLGIEEL